MKNKSLLNAMKKIGANCEPRIREGEIVGYSVTGIHNKDKIVTWYIQDDEAFCVNCGHASDPSDAMIDYFPGYYAYKIKTAVSHILSK